MAVCTAASWRAVRDMHSAARREGLRGGRHAGRRERSRSAAGRLAAQSLNGPNRASGGRDPRSAVSVSGLGFGGVACVRFAVCTHSADASSHGSWLDLRRVTSTPRRVHPECKPCCFPTRSCATCWTKAGGAVVPPLAAEPRAWGHGARGARSASTPLRIVPFSWGAAQTNATGS